MTNKTSKFVQKAKARTGAFQVIKHFEPKISKLSEIPFVNNDFDNPEICPKQAQKFARPQKKKIAMESYSANSSNIIASNRESKKRNLHQSQNVKLLNYANTSKPLINHSLSSIETEVAYNIQKKRARSSPTKQAFSRVDEQVSSSRRRFQSNTDPTLLKKQMDLKNLKEEILSYKSHNLIKRDQVDSEDAKVKGLRNEIYQTKDRNNSQRQILITELKTEIAEYKKFGSYHVYNLQRQQQQQMMASKKSQKNLNPKMDSKWSFNVPKFIEDYREMSTNGLSDSDIESLVTDSERLSNGSPTLTSSSVSKEESNSSACISVDNESIKSKINEANTLINRIKNALAQIKTMKTSSENFPKRGESNFKNVVNDLRTEAESLLYQIGDNREEKLLLPERPKTRRNEDEDISLNGDKFQTVLECGEPEVTSSIEALHAKLHTISESTESSFSIPKPEKSINEISKQQTLRELVSWGCNTEVTSLSKEIQVSSETRSIGIQPDYNLPIDMGTQVSPKQLTSVNFNVLSIPSRNTELSQQSFRIHDIRPANAKQKTNLSIKSLDTHCIIPKRGTKLEKLNIQLLPSVIIPLERTVKQTLKLSITPDGICQSYLENSSNVALIEIKHSISTDSSVKTNEPAPPLSCKRSSDTNALVSNEIFCNHTDLRSCPLNSDYQECESDSAKKIVLQSYHLYDNFNLHDSGIMNFKSAQSLSKIDSLFYQSFINPGGMESQYSLKASKHFVLDGPVHACTGLESKEVQCTDSLIISEMDRKISCEKIDSRLTPSEITLTLSYSTEEIASWDATAEKRSGNGQRSINVHKQQQSTISINGTDCSSRFDDFVQKNEKTAIAHLEVASNGRYKDEANLFCQSFYAPREDIWQNRMGYMGKQSDVKCTGDVFIAERNKFDAKHFRNKVSFSAGTAIKKRARDQPKVSVHKKINYFNNWVTYYVKTKEFLRSVDYPE